MLQAVQSHGDPAPGVQGKEPAQGAGTRFSGIINDLVSDTRNVAPRTDPAPVKAEPEPEPAPAPGARRRNPVGASRPDAPSRPADAPSPAETPDAPPADPPAAPSASRTPAPAPEASAPATPDGPATDAVTKPVEAPAAPADSAAMAALLAAFVPVVSPDPAPPAPPEFTPLTVDTLEAASAAGPVAAPAVTPAASSVVPVASPALPVAPTLDPEVPAEAPAAAPAAAPKTPEGPVAGVPAPDASGMTAAPAESTASPTAPAVSDAVAGDPIRGRKPVSPEEAGVDPRPVPPQAPTVTLDPFNRPGADAPDPVDAPAPARTAGAALSLPQAKASLDQAVPGVKLQVKTAAPADAPATKPALTELLHQPKPAVETPAILAQGTLDPTAPPALQAQLAQPAPAVPHTAATPGPEAALAALAPGAMAAVRVPAATAAFEAPPAVPHASLVSQVDGSIRWLLKNHEQGAELQLHPESLGTVQIRLRVEGTEVHARVWASDPSALPVLQEHRGSLEASLREQGLNLGSFDLHQGRQGGETPLPTAPSQAAAAFRGTPENGQETPIPAGPAPLNPHRIEIVA